MAKRLFDISLSLIGLVILSPLFVLVALGIAFSSPGPILFRASRVGKNGELFVMHKFRTMHVNPDQSASRITGSFDTRIFRFGALLRRSKIDELPQLYDVLRGKMSIVGPRPEDPVIVNKCYTKEHFETLKVLPGLASPGSIYNYTHGDMYLMGDEPEKLYMENLLPVKLALDIVYVDKANFLYDIRIVLRTLWVILLICLGKKTFSEPPEMKAQKNTRGRFFCVK